MRPAYFPSELACFKGTGTPTRVLWSVGVDPDLHDMPFVILKTSDRGRTIQIEGMQVARVSTDLKAKQAATAMCSSIYGALSLIKELEDGDGDALIVAVESQHVRGPEAGQGATKNPEDMILLAETAGAAKAAISQWAKSFMTVRRLSPLVQHWKAGQQKLDNQRATWRTLGYTEGWGRGSRAAYWQPHIPGCEQFKRTDWQGLGDAAGLALWAMREALKA